MLSMPDLIAPFVRAAIALAVVLILTRLSGLRSFSKMTATDFAMTVATGSVLATIIAGTTRDLGSALLGLAAIFAVQALVSYLRRRFAPVSEAVDNSPLLLMDGPSDPARESPRGAHPRIRPLRPPPNGECPAPVGRPGGRAGNDRRHERAARRRLGTRSGRCCQGSEEVTPGLRRFFRSLETGGEKRRRRSIGAAGIWIKSSCSVLGTCSARMYHPSTGQDGRTFFERRVWGDTRGVIGGSRGVGTLHFYFCVVVSDVLPACMCRDRADGDANPRAPCGPPTLLLRFSYGIPTGVSVPAAR